MEGIKVEETGIVFCEVEFSTLTMEVVVSSQTLVPAYTASHSKPAIFEFRFMFKFAIYLGQRHTGCNLEPIIIYSFSLHTALRQKACPNQYLYQ
jgi:hypothetical protein